MVPRALTASLAMPASLAAVTLVLAAAPAVAERGRVLRSFPTPGTCPTGIAWDGGSLWIADHKADRLVAVDPVTGAAGRSLAAPSWRTVGLAWDGSRLWTVDGAERVAYRVDPATGASDRRFELEAGLPRGLAWAGGRLWVSDASKGGRFHEVDPEDGTTIRTIPAPSRGVAGLAIAGGVLWAADRSDDTIWAIDPGSGEVFFGMPSPGPHPIGIAAVGDDLAVADYQKDQVAVVSAAHDDRAKPWRRFDPREVSIEFSYRLRNLGPDPLRSASVFVAVPRDQPWQEVLTAPAFVPAPAAVAEDAGGQPIARFEFADVPAGSSSAVTMTLRARLWSIRWQVLPRDVGAPAAVPKDVARAYLADGDKLAIDDPRIRGAIRKIQERETDALSVARAAYRFVADRLEYEMAGGWNAAPTVLERGTGSCSEYSFSLMSLLRAAGIPARYAGSFVVRGDDASWDEDYHRWVEAYFPGIGWFPMDANKGDKPGTKERASGFGDLDNRVLVTTQSAGGTDAMAWTYNVNSRWVCAGKCKVVEDGVAEWSP
ncbi:MAG: hypothetical protein FJ087_23000 [Deltaproteobacteria bacterium]|nr:hypothetical protein [Deltaproteobacteria bacterium]